MTQDEIIELAKQADLVIAHTTYTTRLEYFAELVFEKGRQQGMKQENALWKLSQTSQEIGSGL